VDNEYLRYDDQKNAFKNTYNYNEENPIELKNNCINEI